MIHSDILRCAEIADAPTADRLREIAADVAALTGVPVAQIMGTQRLPRYVAARHLTWFIANREGMTLAEIGRAAGRDHTTILHGVRREEQRRKIAAVPDHLRGSMQGATWMDRAERHRWIASRIAEGASNSELAAALRLTPSAVIGIAKSPEPTNPRASA